MRVEAHATFVLGLGRRISARNVLAHSSAQSPMLARWTVDMDSRVETLFEELKRYVQWGPEDEAALRAMHPRAAPELARIAEVFYRRIIDHDEARKALEGGESQVGRLKVALEAWLDSLLSGPWGEPYYERRARIGRLHVRIGLPQHYMFGAMNVIRLELVRVARLFSDSLSEENRVRAAIDKILDLELAVMLHTYREDIIAQQAR